MSLQESESSYDHTLNHCTTKQQSCKTFEKLLSNQSQSHFFLFLFIAHKSSHSRQHLLSKIVLIHIQNRLIGFQKAVMKCHNQLVEKLF